MRPIDCVSQPPGQADEGAPEAGGCAGPLRTRDLRPVCPTLRVIEASAAEAEMGLPEVALYILAVPRRDRVTHLGTTLGLAADAAAVDLAVLDS